MDMSEEYLRFEASPTEAFNALCEEGELVEQRQIDTPESILLLSLIRPYDDRDLYVISLIVPGGGVGMSERAEGYDKARSVYRDALREVVEDAAKRWVDEEGLSRDSAESKAVPKGSNYDSLPEPIFRPPDN